MQTEYAIGTHEVDAEMKQLAVWLLERMRVKRLCFDMEILILHEKLCTFPMQVHPTLF
jgi:hypothetical protein